MNGKALVDVQNTQPYFLMPLQRVGVEGLRFPLRVADRSAGSQVVVAKADLGIYLSASHRGTHMSRFVEILNTWQEELNLSSVKDLLQTMCRRLDSPVAWVKFQFAYLLMKNAPVTGGAGRISYDCSVSATLDNGSLSFLLGLKVPVMTVCPCSLAISDTGAHCQRALISMLVRISHFVWLEEFIELAENAGSSAVYPLLKRSDEKHVTEAAFANPVFVEDVARSVATALAAHPRVLGYNIDVTSMESIHNHNAFAQAFSADWQWQA